MKQIAVCVDGQSHMVSERVYEMIAQIVARASQIDQFHAGAVEFNWSSDSLPSARWTEYHRPAKRIKS